MFPRSSTATTERASSESHPWSRRVFWMDFLSAVSLIVPFRISSTTSAERGMTSMKILLWRVWGGGHTQPAAAGALSRGWVISRGEGFAGGGVGAQGGGGVPRGEGPHDFALDSHEHLDRLDAALALGAN